MRMEDEEKWKSALERLRKELSADLKDVQSKLYNHMKDIAGLKVETKSLLERLARIEGQLLDIRMPPRESKRRKPDAHE
jgi:hypothetical protein